MAKAPFEPAGAHHQHHDHDGEDDRIGPHRRNVERGDRLHLREEKPRDGRPADRAHASDDDHREGEQDEVPPHGGKYGIDRGQQHTGDACERNAEGEGTRIDLLHRHTERGGHVAVECRGTHHGAETRAVDDQCRRENEQAAEPHHEQAVERQIGSENLDGTRDWGLRSVRVRAKDQSQTVLQDETEAEGQQKRRDVPIRAVEDALDQAALHDVADRQHQQGHRDEQGPEGQANLSQGKGNKGAHGVEFAMGHVDDVEQPEDDRKPERDEDHGDAERKPGDHLGGEHELNVFQHGSFRFRSCRDQGGGDAQNRVQVSAPMASGPGTSATTLNLPSLMRTTYITCSAWWSPARMVFSPCGVDHLRPRSASRSLSVSVL